MPEDLFNWAPVDMLEPRLDAPFYSRENVINCYWMTTWRRQLKTVHDLTSLVTDGTHITPSYVDVGVPFISARNIDECYINLQKEYRHISPEAHAQLTRQNCTPLKGDILVAKSGKVGTAAINSLSWRFSVFESVAIVRLDSDLDPDYTAAYLNTRFAQNQIERMQKGAVQKHLHLEELREIKVPIASAPLQKAIGNKVRKAARLREIASFSWDAAITTLSDAMQIPINRRFFSNFCRDDVQTSEYRCIDVHPPRAWAIAGDAIAAQYYHPRRVGTRNVVLATGRYAKLCEVAIRLRQSADRQAAPGVVVGLDQIDASTGVLAASSNVASKHSGPGIVFCAETILFSRLRPNLNKVSIWPASWEAGSGSGELLAYRAKEHICPYYLFFLLKSPIGLFQVTDVTAGSTLPRVEPEVVDQILVPRFDNKLEARIGCLVRDSHESWYASEVLLPSVKTDIESLIEGRLNEKQLLAESAEIEQWLTTNPSPLQSR